MRAIERRDLVSGKTLARIGLGLLLLGVVFLYRWGVEQNLITPAARIGVGIAISLGLLGTGWMTRARQPVFGLLLQGGGVAGLYLSAFAAHARYEMTSPTAVFTQLIFVSFVAIGLAVYQETELLAVVGVLGAFSAPLVVPGTIEFFPGDAGYVALVLVSVGVLLCRFDWMLLYTAAAVLSGATLATELTGLLNEWDFSPGEALVAYGAALIALWAAPLLRVATGRTQNGTVAMVATVTVPLATFFGAWAAWGRPVSVVWGGAAIAMSVVMATVYLGGRKREAFLATLHLLPASVFVLAAAALMLDGPSLVVAVAAQGVGFVLIGRLIQLEPLEIVGWALYSIPAVLTIAEIVSSTSGDTPIWNGTSLSRLGVIVLSAVLAVKLRSDDADPLVVRVLLGFGHLSFLAWALSEFSRTHIGPPAASIVWGTYSVVIISQAWGRSSLGRNIGLATLLLTVAKVFLIDLDNASGGAKILLLMGFGLVLLALGYLMPSEPESDEDPADAMPATPEMTSTIGETPTDVS